MHRKLPHSQNVLQNRCRSHTHTHTHKPQSCIHLTRMLGHIPVFSLIGKSGHWAQFSVSPERQDTEPSFLSHQKEQDIEPSFLRHQKDGTLSPVFYDTWKTGHWAQFSISPERQDTGPSFPPHLKDRTQSPTLRLRRGGRRLLLKPGLEPSSCRQQVQYLNHSTKSPLWA